MALAIQSYFPPKKSTDEASYSPQTGKIWARMPDGPLRPQDSSTTRRPRDCLERWSGASSASSYGCLLLRASWLDFACFSEVRVVRREIASSAHHVIALLFCPGLNATSADFEMAIDAPQRPSWSCSTFACWGYWPPRLREPRTFAFWYWSLSAALVWASNVVGRRSGCCCDCLTVARRLSRNLSASLSWWRALWPANSLYSLFWSEAHTLGLSTPMMRCFFCHMGSWLIRKWQ